MGLLVIMGERWIKGQSLTRFFVVLSFLGCFLFSLSSYAFPSWNFVFLSLHLPLSSQ